jgi:regulator of sigma E protease
VALKVLYWAEVVLGFGALIFVHELGHFLAAKWNGVKVTRFAIGFDFWGIRLFRKTIGETEYVIGAFPLGGYVKMLGQEDLPAKGEEEPVLPAGHFMGRSVWARTQIISAGVIANFLLAFFLCYGAYLVGYHRYQPEVGSVGFESLEAGLRPGDVVVSIAGDHVESWTELFMAYALSEAGTDVDIVVDRDGAQVELQIPVLRDPADPINFPDFERAIGLQVAGIVKDSPAEAQGVLAGDHLVALDGETLTGWSHFSALVSRRPGETVDLEVQHIDSRGQPADHEVIQLTLDEADDVYAPTRGLGFGPGEEPIIDSVLSDSPAHRAGLQDGDRITAVDGLDTPYWRDVWLALEYGEGGQPRTLSVERGGETRALSVIPEAAQHWGIGIWGLPVLGVVHRAPETTRIGTLVADGPADAAGLQHGDRLVSLAYDDEEQGEQVIELFSWNHVYVVLARLPDDSWVRVTVDREGRELVKSIQVTPDTSGKRRGMVGVYGSLMQEKVRMGPIEAIWPSLVKPFTLFDEFLKGFRAMFSGRVSPKTISGPVGILSMTYSAASQGMGDLLLLLALISVNLAIVNFLPIPITDGGHFCFLMYEKIRGRRMSEEVQGALLWAGLAFLLAVFVLVTWNDLARIILGR